MAIKNESRDKHEDSTKEKIKKPLICRYTRQTNTENKVNFDPLVLHQPHFSTSYFSQTKLAYFLNKLLLLPKLRRSKRKLAVLTFGNMCDLLSCCILELSSTSSNSVANLRRFSFPFSAVTNEPSPIFLEYNHFISTYVLPQENYPPRSLQTNVLLKTSSSKAGDQKAPRLLSISPNSILMWG